MLLDDVSKHIPQPAWHEVCIVHRTWDEDQFARRPSRG